MSDDEDMMAIEESDTPIVDKQKAAVQEDDQAPPSEEATMPAALWQESEVTELQEDNETEMPDEPFWRRPQGRGPVGKEWDTRTGTWVPLGKALGPKWIPTRQLPDKGRAALREAQSESGQGRGVPAAARPNSKAQAPTQPAQPSVRARVARGRKSAATLHS
tara:strand:+ start:3338 stop:3823 length:486 start_codon:yes stop_codon:yes gene_type:complete